MNKVKRGLKQTHHGGVDANERAKHQNLLQEYLQLQKEFVSKKRKLKTVQEKRATLLAEVCFLRARHGYLLQTQHKKLDIYQNHAQTQNLTKRRKMLAKGNENNSNGGKGVGKKKTSCQDPLTLQVQNFPGK